MYLYPPHVLLKGFAAMASEQKPVGIRKDLIDKRTGRPAAVGLYDPSNEKDACGVGFIVDLSGKQTRETVNNAITMLEVRPVHSPVASCRAR